MTDAPRIETLRADILRLKAECELLRRENSALREDDAGGGNTVGEATLAMMRELYRQAWLELGRSGRRAFRNYMNAKAINTIELKHLRSALQQIIDRSRIDPMGTSKVIDMRRIAQDAVEQSDLNRRFPRTGMIE